MPEPSSGPPAPAQPVDLGAAMRAAVEHPSQQPPAPAHHAPAQPQDPHAVGGTVKLLDGQGKVVGTHEERLQPQGEHAMPQMSRDHLNAEARAKAREAVEQAKGARDGQAIPHGR